MVVGEWGRRGDAPGWRWSFIVGFHHPHPPSTPIHSPPNLRWGRSCLRKTLMVRPRPVSPFSWFLLFLFAQAPPYQMPDSPTAFVATRCHVRGLNAHNYYSLKSIKEQNISQRLYFAFKLPWWHLPSGSIHREPYWICSVFSLIDEKKMRMIIPTRNLDCSVAKSAISKILFFPAWRSSIKILGKTRVAE